MSNRLNNNKYGKTVLGLFLASLFLSAPVFAEAVYSVRNSDELIWVLTNAPETHKRIVFIDNVVVYAGQEFILQQGAHVTLDLSRFNFQGNQSAIFGGDGEVVIIRGSTTAFNEGFDLRDTITLTYEGIYSMSGVDRFATSSNCDVTVNLVRPGSTWQGSTLPGPYLWNTGMAGDRDGTILIGDVGRATMNAGHEIPGAPPITVRNAETVLGAESTGDGTLNLRGGTVDWFTSGSFYVGYHGRGRLNISEGIELRTGSIVVGKEVGSDGIMNIGGVGTIVNLYGRNEDMGRLQAQGTGVMNLTTGALLNFEDTTTYFRDISGYTPKLGLGDGTSVVLGATIRGVRLRDVHTKDLIVGQTSIDHSLGMGTDSIFAQAGQILGTQDGTLDGPFNENTLHFQSNSLLEGSLNIAMRNVIFNGNDPSRIATLSPGAGQYDGAEFGRINFITDNLTLGPNSATFIDFSVHGDLNFNDPNDHRYGVDSAYDDLYLGDWGRDVISVSGGIASLGGDLYFRPQSGYYSDRIDVRFMELHYGAVENGQFDSERVHIIPSRWFSNHEIEWDDSTVDFFGPVEGIHLRMDRHTTPFTDAANTFNTRSVGGALEHIYNEQTNRGWLTVLNWVWLMDDDEFRKAMQQLAGETRASSFLMPVRSPWRLVFDRMTTNEVVRFQRERERQQRNQWDHCGSTCTFRGHSARTSTGAKNGLWAAPYYDFLRARDDGNVSTATHSRIGFITGYDRALSNRSSLGVVFSYSNPELRQVYSRVKADDYMVGLHFNTLLQNRYELKLWGSYGTQAYRMNRNIPLPHTDGRLRTSYTGNTAAFSSQIAMPLQWRSFTFRPHAALDLNYVQQNSATENGYEQVRMHYYSASWTQLLGRIGVRADYNFRRWDVSSTLGYSFMFAGDTAPMVRNQFVTDGPAFDIKGNDLGRHFFSHGIGARRWLNDQNTRMLFIQYSGEYGRNSNAQTAMIGCQFVF